MKKSLLVALALVLALVLTGCSSDYTITQTGDSITFKANAKDGSEAESDYISLGDGWKAVVDADLSEGSILVEFVECLVSINGNDEDVTKFGPLAEVTVNGKEKKDVKLVNGDYVVRLTAKGTAKGTVKVTVEKQ